MPPVLPFAGLRYTAPGADLAQLVSPPYDVISSTEQAALLSASPHNVVRLELPADAPDQPGSRYQQAAGILREWRAANVLRADARAAYYLSQTQYSYANATLRRRDLLAAVAVEPWSAQVALPHEHTMAGPKADRLELLRATHLNASPIWLLARDQLPELDQAWAEAESRSPDAEFTWRDELHRLWLVDAADVVEALRVAFGRSRPLYIADGHHRYETSLAFRSEAGEALAGARATLATITWADDPGLMVLPTHRLLNGLDPSLTLEAVLARLGVAFDVAYYPVSDDVVQRLAASGRAGPSFGLYGLGQTGQFGILELHGGKPPADALPADRSDAWKSLDVSLLHTLLIDPLVEQTGRPRDEVLRYTRDPHEALGDVRDGRASVAFFLNPTPVQSVLAVADAGDLMPEKSTYFFPKPPAGVVMRDLERQP
jgi:uncharacterized protein (DUF1015 family)